VSDDALEKAVMSNAADLLIKVESLKNMLVARATGGFADDQEYASLRRDLIGTTRIKDRLPRFITTCRSLDEFWGFIQPKYGRYQERREFLQHEFDPLLTMLESDWGSPGDTTASTALEKVDSTHVRETWARCLDRRSSDPEGAITAARTLLETVCKHILEDEGVEYDDKADLPKLYSLVAQQLRLAPSQHTEDAFRQILGGCCSVVGGLACLRNRLSDAHGKAKKAVRPSSHRAELAVNLAGSMAAFLISTLESKTAWEAQHSKRNGLQQEEQ